MKKRPLRPAAQPRSEPETEVQHRPSDATPIPQDEPGWDSLGSTQVTSDIAGIDTVLKAKDGTITQSGAHKTPLRSRLGEFQLIKKLGEGAMGAVYKAKQMTFDPPRIVALKVLFKHVADNPKLVQRLDREAHAMFGLDHPNLVASFAVDEFEGWHYVAMEYIRGRSLQSWIDALGKLSVGDAVHVTLACLDGLHHAHEMGLVHRDIKPENILVSRFGEVKITDLGMVKTADEDMSLTQTGHAVGTPWYMPLEQARNAKEVDHRVDIYALGCMLYCMLTGRPPFAGGTIVDVISAKERGTFPPARQSNREVPERLDLIILKMTAKDPKYRYQSCAEAYADLERLGLANEQLTFLSLQNDDIGEHRPEQSGVGLTRHSSVSDTPQAELPPDEWYLRFRTTEGKVNIRKVSTSQVVKLIEDSKLDPSAKISRRRDDGYRALATYKEFEQITLARAARKAADEKAVRYRNLYKQIEDTEEKKADEGDNAQMTYLMPILLKFGGGFVLLGIIATLLGYFMNIFK